MWCRAEVIGRDAIDGVVPSDHYGVVGRSCATETSADRRLDRADQLEDARRRQVLLGDRDAERRQRVFDRVAQGRRRHDHPALAHAAEVDVRVEGHRLEMVDLDARDLGRGGQQVVHERAGEELRVVVVRGALEQDSTDALRDTAAHLALDDRGVDQRTAVLDDDVALDRHLTGLDVDLDDRAVGATRPSAFAAVERTGRFERLGRACRDIRKRDRARRAPLAPRPCPR